MRLNTQTIAMALWIMGALGEGSAQQQAAQPQQPMMYPAQMGAPTGAPPSAPPVTIKMQQPMMYPAQMGATSGVPMQQPMAYPAQPGDQPLNPSAIVQMQQPTVRPVIQQPLDQQVMPQPMNQPMGLGMNQGMGSQYSQPTSVDQVQIVNPAINQPVDLNQTYGAPTGQPAILQAAPTPQPLYPVADPQVGMAPQSMQPMQAMPAGPMMPGQPTAMAAPAPVQMAAPMVAQQPAQVMVPTVKKEKAKKRGSSRNDDDDDDAGDDEDEGITTVDDVLDRPCPTRVVEVNDQHEIVNVYELPNTSEAMYTPVSAIVPLPDPNARTPEEIHDERYDEQPDVGGR